MIATCSGQGRMNWNLKIILTLGLMTLGCAGLTATAVGGDPVPYDLNQDGKFDIEDVKYAAGIVVGREITDEEADVNNDGKITVEDIISLSDWVTNGTPTPAPTATPGPTVTPTPTPEPTPTPTSDTFDIEDYFILTNASLWEYRADDGASPDDDFDWTITGTQNSPDMVTNTVINYIVKDPGDEKDGDKDFWHLDNDGVLFYYGFHNGVETGDFSNFRLAGDQDIWLSDPFNTGGRGLMVGQEITDTVAGSAMIKPPFSNTPVATPFSGSATIKYTRRENVTTHMGTFNDCIRVEIDISASGFTFLGSTFWLKEGVGMVKQDQVPDGNDAETHSLQGGNVGGVAITPDVPSPPAAPAKPAAAE